MKNQTAPSPPRVRIYSHVTQSRFLHVEDALAIEKLRLFAGNYRKGQGMDTYAHAFVDIADARVLFGALARGEQNFSHREYKGTPPKTHPEQSRRNGQTAVSRVLSVAVKGENVYVELKSRPGKVTPTGAITPNGSATVEVNVTFKLYEARRMGAAVLAYLHAWDVLRMMYQHDVLGHQQSVGQPAPYISAPLNTSLIVTKASEQNGVSSGTAKPKTDPVQKNGIHPQQPVVANGRPVTRKSNDQANGKAASPTNGSKTVKQPLQYGNGTLVDGKNLMEVQTYRQYVAEKQSAPASKTALLEFYWQSCSFSSQAMAAATTGSSSVP